MSEKRQRDAPPHSLAQDGPSDFSFDFAPPREELPILSKKQRKEINYASLNPRNRPLAGSAHILRVDKKIPISIQDGEKVEMDLKVDESVEKEEEEEVEVVAVSHKAARLAKRRKLAGLPEVEVVVPSTAGNTIAGMPGVIVGNTPGKSAFGIWLGNMNYSTTNKMLLSWLDERGLKDIVRINMPMGRRSGEMNRGFAYLDFPTADDVEKAVALSEQNLDGRKLLIKASSDFTGRPNSTLPILDSSALLPSTTGEQNLNRDAKRILDKQKNQNGGTLFLGNLGFEATVDTIRELFDGNQKDVGVIINVVDGEEVEEEVDEFGERIKTIDEDRGSDDDDSEDETEENVMEQEVLVDETVDISKLPVKKLERKPKREKGVPLDLTKAKDAGIRKIRLGTFEDTGKCKGWAFVDFHLPAQCTRALLNIKNHALDGRSLNIEYASAEAVRRGGIGTRSAVPSADRGRGGSRGGRGSSDRGNSKSGMARGKGREWDDEDTTTASKEYVDYSEASERAPRGEFGFRPDSNRGASRGSRGRGARGGDRGGRGGDRGGRGGSGTERIKSGAALAGAQRASEGIVESTGKKITFS